MSKNIASLRSKMTARRVLEKQHPLKQKDLDKNKN